MKITNPQDFVSAGCRYHSHCSNLNKRKKWNTERIKRHTLLAPFKRADEMLKLLFLNGNLQFPE
jgi:hypothetical protein